MNKPRSTSPRRPDPVGGGAAWRPSWGYLTIALVLVVGGLVYLGMSMTATDNAKQAAIAPQSTASAHEVASAWPVQAAVPTSEPPARATMPAPDPHRPPEGDADPTPDLSSYVARGENPSVAEVIEQLHQRGIHTGLGAFQPPGTRPPMVGLAVPEGYVLPEGYVRHYQATDDGQRIEPILMFAPDRQFFDANHRPIEVPKDRVVTPELAPPGFPIRRIVVPAPIDSGRSGL